MKVDVQKGVLRLKAKYKIHVLGCKHNIVDNCWSMPSKLYTNFEFRKKNIIDIQKKHTDLQRQENHNDKKLPRKIYIF